MQKTVSIVTSKRVYVISLEISKECRGISRGCISRQTEKLELKKRRAMRSREIGGDIKDQGENMPHDMIILLLLTDDEGGKGVDVAHSGAGGGRQPGRVCVSRDGRSGRCLDGGGGNHPLELHDGPTHHVTVPDGRGDGSSDGGH